jgi:hypothetical protein
VQYLVKGAQQLTLTEMRGAVQTLIPNSGANKTLQRNLGGFCRSLADELSLYEQKKHPLILIIDDVRISHLF